MRNAGVVVFFLLIHFWPLGARADDAVQSAQSIISGQITAFLNEDAETAYSFASPEIKARFPDSSAFFGMVKQSYAPVSNPGNYAFGRNKANADGSRVFQEVLISGADGKNWAAFYDVVRQPDGRYNINGVRVALDTINQGI